LVIRGKAAREAGVKGATPASSSLARAKGHDQAIRSGRSKKAGLHRCARKDGEMINIENNPMHSSPAVAGMGGFAKTL